MSKLALQANLCYNELIKCFAQAMLETSLSVTIQHRVKGQLYRMTTLPPHASNDNTKHCNGCNRDLPATLRHFSPQKQNKDGLTSWCKQCHATNAARYRKANPEKVKAGQQQYNASDARKASKARYRPAHRKQIKEYQDQWHTEHREEQRLYCAEYNAANHEARLEFNRHYNIEHRDEKNTKTRQHRQTEHGRMLHRTQENARHARKKSIEGTLTLAEIQQKLKAQRYLCYYCARKFEQSRGEYLFHLEHTVPISRTEHNPRHDVNFIVLACPTCNLKKNNKLPHEWPEGGRLF